MLCSLTFVSTSTELVFVVCFSSGLYLRYDSGTPAHFLQEYVLLVVS